MTVVQGTLKSMPIICIYVTYVTISLMFVCFLTFSKHYQMFCSLVLSNKVKLSSLFYHYCIDDWIIHVACEYLVYEDFCGWVGQFN